jgi:hypothetical protein
MTLRAWVRAGARQRNRMLTAQPGVLGDAFLSDMALSHQLRWHEPRLAHRMWSGAWLRTLGWLAQEGIWEVCAKQCGVPGEGLGRRAPNVPLTPDAPHVIPKEIPRRAAFLG